MQTTKTMTELYRVLRLEELRLRSAALAYASGLGSMTELGSAANAYGDAVRRYKKLAPEYMGHATDSVHTTEIW